MLSTIADMMAAGYAAQDEATRDRGAEPWTSYFGRYSRQFAETARQRPDQGGDPAVGPDRLRDARLCGRRLARHRPGRRRRSGADGPLLRLQGGAVPRRAEGL